MAKCEKCDCCDAALEIEETAYWNGKKSGTESERKRIIKLLEGVAIVTKNGEIAVMELLSAIKALIKEENK